MTPKQTIRDLLPDRRPTLSISVRIDRELVIRARSKLKADRRKRGSFTALVTAAVVKYLEE